MSDPLASGRQVQVTVAAQCSGEARIRVDATLDSGEVYTAWHVITVRPAPVMSGIDWVHGPTTLHAVVS